MRFLLTTQSYNLLYRKRYVIKKLICKAQYMLGFYNVTYIVSAQDLLDNLLFKIMAVEWVSLIRPVLRFKTFINHSKLLSSIQKKINSNRLDLLSIACTWSLQCNFSFKSLELCKLPDYINLVT